eukprot:gnl/TRDRNA2_/TRDRNA2_165278_c0_seq3.p1 gnl/TRDRNA2_/TRDRNA2_165278_c0~~gnl/TRDRNA2_/TRDRNA2_165278_c0_seq3.p1  ORF type:complete len:597 (+),score=111.99 gnl/TRDRNA2_/TRDRNA2_165278_c0_seq3:122-1912(+)
MIHGPTAAAASPFVKSKLDEFFWEWLSLPETQKIVRRTCQLAQGDASVTEPNDSYPSPLFSALRGSPTARPSPPGSPLSRGFSRDAGSEAGSLSASEWGQSEYSAMPPTSPVLRDSAADKQSPLAHEDDVLDGKEDEHRLCGSSMLASGAKEIPRFWWPKRTKPAEQPSNELRQKISDQFAKLGITEIKTSQQLEPFVLNVFGLSKYLVLPIFHKIKAFFEIDSAAKSQACLTSPSSTPITQAMLLRWCQGRIQVDDPVLSFFYVVKKDHNNWIERDDFSIFLRVVLSQHPGLDFLRETQEFQDRYADTVISRIFFVYDRKDVGRIYIRDIRRYRPSVIDTWKQLAEHDDIKMVRDYFSYEHFYVMYCTFWELDSDHDFLLDKDDLLKYDGHALSRRAIERIFSEVPSKFTSAVPGKMGYEDFIRFLLCDQDRQTDRSVEYWFHLFDLDGDGCIRDHEMRYFYEEQVQRMECLNYETISFADIMCQMNDMMIPKTEGTFKLSDFKRRKKFAGIFFSLFSSLNKFLAFEHRDPFSVKQEQLDNPNYSDWDRFCADEYLRLAMEEGEEPEENSTRNEGFVDEVAAKGGGKGRGADVMM